MCSRILCGQLGIVLSNCWTAVFHYLRLFPLDKVAQIFLDINYLHISCVNIAKIL